MGTDQGLSPGRWALAYAPALLWAILIAVITSLPTSRLPTHDLLEFDKLIHLLVYLVLALLIALGSHRTGMKPWFSPLFCVGYALFDELHQLFIPSRIASFGDWFADVAGIVLGLFLAWRIGWYGRKKERV